MNNTITQDERLGLPSASGAEIFLNCPGSPAAQAEALKQPNFKPDNAVSEQGTRIHAVLETGDASGVEEDEAEIAKGIEEIIERTKQQWIRDFNLNPANIIELREERLWIRDRVTLDPLASAKVDRAFICGEYALVIDAKTGFKDATPSYRNAQLRWQALAVHHEYPKVKHVRVKIAQYRFKENNDPACDYDLKALHGVEGEFLLARWRSQQPNAPRFAGSWCRYCKAAQAGICREAASYSLLPVASIGVKAVDANPKKEQVLALVNTLSVEELAAINSRKSLANSVFDAVTARLKSLPAETLASVGLQLEDGGKVREVTDFQGLLNVLGANGLCTVEDFKRWVTIGVGDMEKHCVRALAVKQGITQKAAVPLFKNLIEPFIAFTPKSQVLKKLDFSEAKA